MNILIIQLGTMVECLVSTCLFRGLAKKYGGFDNCKIYAITANKECKVIFEHNQSIEKVYSLDENVMPSEIDLVINLSPGFKVHSDADVVGFSPDNSKYYEVLFGKQNVNKNIFQVYYDLAGLTWKGEGYNFNYYPRTRSNKKKTGLTLANANLRDYVVDRLHLEESKLWHVPFKKNFLKKVDEINKCQNIITDNFTSMHIAVSLRKNVYFLQLAEHHTMDLEFFGKGTCIQVPVNILRWT